MLMERASMLARDTFRSYQVGVAVRSARKDAARASLSLESGQIGRALHSADKAASALIRFQGKQPSRNDRAYRIADEMRGNMYGALGWLRKGQVERAFRLADKAADKAPSLTPPVVRRGFRLTGASAAGFAGWKLLENRAD
jgi:hypothetical protein